MENVPNLLTAEKGYFFNEIETLFNAMGYFLQHGVLNAADLEYHKIEKEQLLLAK